MHRHYAGPSYPALPPLHIELAHHLVILMLDVMAVDDEFAGEVVEFHDDPYLLVWPEQDRILPAALLIAQWPVHRGNLSWPVNPQNITVLSSLGGSAKADVELK